MSRLEKVAGARPERRRGITLALAFLLSALGSLVAGCGDDDDDCTCCGPDHSAPAAPRGLYSLTGDERVTLVWLANTEGDLDGYRIWWSDAYDGEYHLIATVSPSGEYYEEYVDVGAENGETYFYGVTAFDVSGNESDLSLESVSDTPRPEGHAALSSIHLSPETSALDFFDGQGFADVVPASALDADFFYEYVPETGDRLLVTAHPDQVFLQDMGYTSDFDEIDAAPRPGEGWSPSGIAEAVAGHTYVFRILDDPEGFYAKVRVTGVDAQAVSFQWAFQTQAGNRELSLPQGRP